jgi:hypothetical protein
MIATRSIYRDPWYAAALAALAALVVVAAIVHLTGRPPGAAQTSKPDPRPAATVDVVAGTLDYARGVDLGQIAGALGAYRIKHGAYPNTGGKLTLLCGDDGNEPGCALIEVNPDVPVYRGGEPYWYISDGRSFTIVSTAAQPGQDMSTCPKELPPGISQAICLRGGE